MKTHPDKTPHRHRSTSNKHTHLPHQQFIFLATLPTVFKDKYTFSTSTVGLVYTGLMVGFAVGVALSATVMDRIAMRRSEKGGHKPENRLVPIVYASPLIPAGLLLYGWSLQAGLHFAVPVVGSALVGAGMVLTLVCIVFDIFVACLSFPFRFTPPSYFVRLRGTDRVKLTRPSCLSTLTL